MKTVALQEIATITAGQSPQGNTYNRDGIGLPFFQGKADFGATHPTARKWCSAPAKIAEAGDILISVRAPVGPTNIAAERCCIGRGLAGIRPRSDKVALRDFVHWAIRRREPLLVTKAQGSTFAAIGQKDLKALPIPLPPLDEQRRIVDILNRAARIEALRRRASERLREFVPALFVEMFGDPVENSKGWEVAHLGAVCAIVGGGTPRRNNPAYFGGAIPWARPTDVTGLKSLTIESTGETLTEAGLQQSSARLVPAGTVLLTSRATIGVTAIAAVELATNQGFANLTCRTRLVPEYLACWLRSRRTELIRLAGGTTFKEISKSAIRKMEAPLPPLDRQRRFAAIVGKVQAAVARAVIGTQTASELEASLMSRLLSDGA